MPVSKPGNERTVSTYCYQCVAGPDLLNVRIEDGVATEINAEFRGGGGASGRRQGVRQGVRPPAKGYNAEPRALSDEAHQPEQGPRARPGLRAHFLGRGARSRRGQAQGGASCGLLRRDGFPRLAASFGGGGTPTAYMGTLPALLAPPGGAVDYELRLRPGREMLPLRTSLRRLLHRAFTVSPDTPLCEYFFRSAPMWRPRAACAG